ncbi:hypothetical protein PC128_g18093 [Phytophthora cactorum]|nr:hypothetical protein PC128_g18093 [Phytophthora cactorum]
MMNPGASIVPYNEQNSAAADAVESGGETGMLGAMIRRNRTLAVNVNRQKIEVREEVFAMEHSGQRDDLERELQESRRRIDEQGLVLDMRSQQLLNYTHEHAERSRVESERRLEEQIKNGILSSHNRIQEDVREQTQNLALQIQEQLCADRQRETGEMETRLTPSRHSGSMQWSWWRNEAELLSGRRMMML